MLRTSYALISFSCLRGEASYSGLAVLMIVEFWTNATSTRGVHYCWLYLDCNFCSLCVELGVPATCLQAFTGNDIGHEICALVVDDAFSSGNIRRLLPVGRFLFGQVLSLPCVVDPR
jgi:hypothetical protein